ncbi:MAG: DUF1592 domain-containing protein [Myxococcota bacterium]
MVGLTSCYSGLQTTPAEDDGAATDTETNDATGSDGDHDGSCETLAVGGSRMRRMTRNEYNRTVSELLSITTTIADTFAPDNRARGFDNQAEVQEVSPAEIAAWEQAAEVLTAEAMADMTAFVGCDVTGSDEDACVASFLADFGLRAFRRPLSAAELDKYTAFYLDHRAQSGPERALEMLVQAMLMSPKFLYLVEPGSEAEPSPLDDYAIASRLSYLLWNSMPDATLFQAAAAGELSTREGIEAQARRMIADPRAEDVVRDFYLQWMDAYALEALHLPEGFDASLVDSTRTGLRLFIEDWYDNGGLFSELLTSNTVFADDVLAEYYGLADASGGEPIEAALDPETHAGLLTRAAFLGTHSIPPSRGDFVLNKLLCATLVVPPIEIPPPPEGEEYETQRERFEAHAAMDCAAACHRLIDPLGFTFEHYDHSGRWRNTDNGHPIDATTDVVLSFAPELDGPVDGAIELSERLSRSETVMACQVEKWFTYAYSRPPRADDNCAKEQLVEAFIAADGELEPLLVSLTLSDAFRFVRKEEPEETRP